MSKQLSTKEKKEKVNKLIHVWLARANVQVGQAAQRTGLTEDIFYRSYLDVKRKVDTDSDRAISVIKAFSEGRLEKERCRAAEAIEFLDLTSTPPSRFDEIANLFPREEWLQAIRKFQLFHTIQKEPISNDTEQLPSSTENIKDFIEQQIGLYARNAIEFSIIYSESLWQGRYTSLNASVIPINIIFEVILSNPQPPKDKDVIQKERPILDYINEYQKLFILGHAGSGKTTVLLQILRLETEKILVNNTFTHLPVYVSLTRLSSQSNILTLIINNIKNLGLDMAEEQVIQALQKGLLIILLDGLNEISTANRRDLGIGVLNFINEYPENKYYVTSRPYDFEVSIHRDMFSVLIQPLDINNMRTFIENYLGLDDSKTFMVKIGLNNEVNELKNNSLLKILQNPLMLLMSIDIFITRDEVQLTKATIFKSFFNTLFTRERQLSRPNKFDSIVKLRFLANLAFRMFESGYILSAEKVRVLRLFDNASSSTNTVTSQQIVEIIEELSINGFLRYPTIELEAEQRVEWYHQRFQEYFAAVKLAEMFNEKEDIHVYLNNGAWKDIITLVAELVRDPKEYVLEIISGWRGLIGMIESRNHRLVLGSHVIVSNQHLFEENFYDSVLKDLQLTIDTSLGTRLIELAGKVLKRFGFLVGFIGKIFVALQGRERLQTIGIWLVGLSGDPTKAKSVIKYLKDPRNRIRWITASTLEKLQSHDAIDALIEALDDPDKDIRWKVIRALTAINDTRGIIPLMSLLRHYDADTRAGAIIALADLHVLDAVSLLEEIRNDPLNGEVLRWGPTVVDVIEDAINRITSNRSG